MGYCAHGNKWGQQAHLRVEQGAWWFGSSQGLWELVFLVLMQKSQSGGMGSAFGGGMAESAFGSDTSNVLTKATIYTTIAFFIIALILYLMYQTNASDEAIGLDVESIAPIVEASTVEAADEGEVE